MADDAVTGAKAANCDVANESAGHLKIALM